jgi:hypothetical protein
VLDVQQRKSDQPRDPRHRGDYDRELEPRNAHLGIQERLHGECLVKIHVTDITAAGGGVCETNLGIQICSVEIDLTTILMDDIARLLDAVFKHTVSRRVGDLVIE